MPSHIGIVAVSPEGTSICYRLIGRHVGVIDDAARRPLITLHNQPFPNYVEALREDDWETIGHMLSDSARILADAGADFCILPDNVAHHALPLAESSSPIPWVNMIDLVVEQIMSCECRQVGLIGTKYVTYGATYQTALGLRGIPLYVPEEGDADALDKVIFTEAVYGIVSDSARESVGRIIARLRERCCDALVLGSSEAALMLPDDLGDLKVFDPIQLLAEHAVNRALSDDTAEAA